MIDHLHDVLPYLEHLPPEIQEEVASHIESLIDKIEHEAFMAGRIRHLLQEMQTTEDWEDPAGAWSDLPDTMLEELDLLRHANPPTPPLDQL